MRDDSYTSLMVCLSECRRISFGSVHPQQRMSAGQAAARMHNTMNLTHPFGQRRRFYGIERLGRQINVNSSSNESFFSGTISSWSNPSFSSSHIANMNLDLPSTENGAVAEETSGFAGVGELHVV